MVPLNSGSTVVAPIPSEPAVASIIFDCITLPSASWLFYVRLSAVYLQDKRATLFFGVLWTGVMGYFIFDAVSVHARFTHLHFIDPQEIDAWNYIINAIYDTLAYLSVSWQLASFSMKGDSWKHRVMSLTTGDGLLGLTKALLRSGQIYYLLSGFLLVFLYSNYSYNI